MPKGIGYTRSEAFKKYGGAMKKAGERLSARVHGKRAMDTILAMGGVAVKKKGNKKMEELRKKAKEGALKGGTKGLKMSRARRAAMMSGNKKKRI